MKFLIGLLIGLLLQLGCSTPEEKARIEVKNGITFVYNPRIEMKEKYLEPELIIGENEDDGYLFAEISDIKEDNNGTIYLVDRLDHNIKVFTSDGTFSHLIGSEGEGPGEFREPFQLDFHSNGNLVVSDVQNRRFQVFTPEGNYLNSYKMDMDSPGKFAIDSQDNLYNKSYYFIFGNESEENPLFYKYGKDFNLISGIGSMIDYNEPFEKYLMNNCDLVVDSQDRIIASYQILNKIIIFDEDSLRYVIERPLFFDPVEPEIKTKTDGGSITITANYDPISFDIDIDSKNNFYLLTSYNKDEDDEKDKEDDKENNTPRMVIEIFNSEGILQKVVALTRNNPSNIYIGKDDKIYILDGIDMIIYRFPSIY